jgi:Uncharacterised ACR (DUF711)
MRRRRASAVTVCEISASRSSVHPAMVSGGNGRSREATDMPAKVIRSVCQFVDTPSEQSVVRLGTLSKRLESHGFTVQTTRLCSPDLNRVLELDQDGDGSTFYSVGRLRLADARARLGQLCVAKNVAFNVDLTAEIPTREHVGLLMAIVQNAPAKTFSFTYTFNNAASTPYFPSATYETDGFAIGLQPTNLSSGCQSIDEWLHRLKRVWEEIDSLMRGVEESYLGIDTSIAPLSDGPGSFLNFLRRLGIDWDRAVSSDVFLGISRFIKSAAPRSVGPCGLMFPCMEDFELAEKYEQGRFSVERCVFLSLHSGLGIDSYPVGVDEDPDRMLEVLRLVQGLSDKFRKPLSARFISDGRARIGQSTDLGSPSLRDVTVRPL